MSYCMRMSKRSFTRAAGSGVRQVIAGKIIQEE